MELNHSLTGPRAYKGKLLSLMSIADIPKEFLPFKTTRYPLSHLCTLPPLSFQTFSMIRQPGALGVYHRPRNSRKIFNPVCLDWGQVFSQTTKQTTNVIAKAALSLHCFTQLSLSNMKVSVNLDVVFCCVSSSFTMICGPLFHHDAINICTNLCYSLFRSYQLSLLFYRVSVNVFSRFSVLVNSSFRCRLVVNSQFLLLRSVLLVVKLLLLVIIITSQRHVHQPFQRRSFSGLLRVVLVLQ